MLLGYVNGEPVACCSSVGPRATFTVCATIRGGAENLVRDLLIHSARSSRQMALGTHGWRGQSTGETKRSAGRGRLWSWSWLPAMDSQLWFMGFLALFQKASARWRRRDRVATRCA